MTPIRLNEIKERLKVPTQEPYKPTQAEIDCRDLLQAYELLFSFLERNIGKKSSKDDKSLKEKRWDDFKVR